MTSLRSARVRRMRTKARMMARFTATARGLGEWIASHGPLTSMSYVQSEPMGDATVLRYRATVGEAELWFSVTLSRDEKITQISWW